MGGFEFGPQPQHGTHHEFDLLLRSPAEAGNGLLDLQRSVLVQRDFRRGGCKDGHTAPLGNADGRADIGAEKQLLHGRAVGCRLANHSGKVVVNGAKAPGKGRGWDGLDAAGCDKPRALAVMVNDTIACAGEARVYSDDAHGHSLEARAARGRGKRWTENANRKDGASDGLT